MFNLTGINENNPTLSKMKHQHPLEEQKFLKSIDYPGIDSIIEGQQKKMDPDAYLLLCLENYRNKIIV